MNPKEQEGFEKNMRNKGRIVTGWWDGLPVHRPMTAYEKFAHAQKQMGAEVIDEETFNLGAALLGDRDWSKLLMINKT